MERRLTEITDRYLAAADHIGGRICRDAIWDGKRCNWFGAAPSVRAGQFGTIHRTFGPDLYAGTSGIALFLAQLAAMLPNPTIRETAIGAANHAISRIDDLTDNGFGIYTGMTGVSYALARIGKLLNNESLIDQALDTMAEVASASPRDTQLDLLSGSAGAVIAALSMYQEFPSDPLIETAVRFGDHLISQGRQGSAGVSWITMNQPVSLEAWNLTGLSHGAAGIAWALLELHKITGDKRFLDAGEEGFAYEDSWYNPQEENWPDFRRLYSDPEFEADLSPCQAAWCHGAPGIGLTRLRAFELTENAAHKSSAEAAGRTSLTFSENAANSDQGNYSLCHGIFGNLEMFIDEPNCLDLPPSESELHRIAGAAIEEYDDRFMPWPCGLVTREETPTLMLGLAGIGYFYLRLVDPVLVPSVLLITPNSRNKTTQGSPIAS
jgi:lantibiotic biosynthesis protein